MADDAVQNFCPPVKKAKYDNGAARRADPAQAYDGKNEDGDNDTLESAQVNGERSEKNGNLQTPHEEEDERQIMNGGLEVFGVRTVRYLRSGI